MMSRPIIIGLAGLAGSGKDTAADTLVTHAGFSKIAFAEALRLEVAGAFGLGAYSHILVDRFTKEKPQTLLAMRHCTDQQFLHVALGADAGIGTDGDATTYLQWMEQPRSPRQIMQWWGTEYRRAQQENYWSTKVAMQISAGIDAGRKRWVITDCRFANEVLALRRIGGELWQVLRTGLASVEGGHASANDGSQFEPEAVLLNGSTVTGLMHSTLRMLQHRYAGLILPDDLEAAA